VFGGGGQVAADRAELAGAGEGARGSALGPVPAAACPLDQLVPGHLDHDIGQVGACGQASSAATAAGATAYPAPRQSPASWNSAASASASPTVQRSDPAPASAPRAHEPAQPATQPAIRTARPPGPPAPHCGNRHHLQVQPDATTTPGRIRPDPPSSICLPAHEAGRPRQARRYSTTEMITAWRLGSRQG
jgi:hypothetical protein